MKGRKFYLIISIVLLATLMGSQRRCCDTYNGYGRYTLRIDCDKVLLSNGEFKIIKRGGDLVLTGHRVAADHTLSRGIYRKTRPWLYVHHIEADKVDITFDSGLKGLYPIYTGASASIFDVFAHPWEMTRSTNAAFPCNYWLVSHRWSGTGIFFDLQQQIGDETRWRLVQGNIFVPGDGKEVTISEIGASVKIISFDAERKKALVKFTNLLQCCNSDSPNCPCFVDGGAWNPGGKWIQDVALDTLGTRESCGVRNGGKPFYQMRLGFDCRIDANLDACNPHGLHRFQREAWCSEAVSYWHHKAHIPYEDGYRNSSWHLDWQLPNTDAIETFYITEEDSRGRGRWIEYDELDYNDFRPGENAPVPGAYVLIRKYENKNWAGHSHSMMIDEMKVYRTANGRVVQVEIKLLEGNTENNMVENSRVIEDIKSVTPDGEDYIGKKKDKIKLKGFGIDLDENLQPIYDNSRLHFVRVPGDKVGPGVSKMPKTLPEVKDPLWDEKHAPLLRELASYAKKVRELKGAAVRSSSKRVQVTGIPDGRKIRWAFPSVPDKVKPQKVEIEIDLHDVHPLPIKGIILKWDGKSLPTGYGVQWAGADYTYKDAVVPKMDPAVISAYGGAAITVPIMFEKSGIGVKVRYVKLIFPQGTLRENALLEQLRFIYDWGPDTDAPDNPVF